jgi:CHAT domain-containing protein
MDEKVLQPVRAFLGDATHLLISPDGQLSLIPFETMVDRRGRYAVERYSITYLTSGRDLLRMQVPRTNRSGPVIIADPFFGAHGGSLLARKQPRSKLQRASLRRQSVTRGESLSSIYFAPLTGTAEEASEIRSLFPKARLLTGRQASKAALEELAAPLLLHIATHGFFLQDTQQQFPASAISGTRARQATVKIENPLLRSGLALAGANLHGGTGSDGILTALEASDLNLWGTKLVTLPPATPGSAKCGMAKACTACVELSFWQAQRPW